MLKLLSFSSIIEQNSEISRAIYIIKFIYNKFLRIICLCQLDIKLIVAISSVVHIGIILIVLKVYYILILLKVYY